MEGGEKSAFSDVYKPEMSEYRCSKQAISEEKCNQACKTFRGNRFKTSMDG
jgi:hypothetical protein